MTTDLTIWTIGHSIRPMEEFLRLLAENLVQTVADIRNHPGSRHSPQYGQVALRDELLKRGLDYQWLPALGGRRRARAKSPNSVCWRNASYRGYADYIQTAEFTQWLADLLEPAQQKPTTLMCAQAVWWRCHRSMVADALKARDVRVLHIMAEHSVTEHPFTAPARICHGQLTCVRGTTAD